MSRRLFEGIEPVSEERQNTATVLHKSDSYMPGLGPLTVVEVEVDGEHRKWHEVPEYVTVIDGRFVALPPATEEEAKEREAEIERFKEATAKAAANVHYGPGEDPDVWHPDAKAILERQVGEIFNARYTCWEHNAEHVTKARITKVIETTYEGELVYELECETIDGLPFCSAGVISKATVSPLWLNELHPGSTPLLGGSEEERFDLELLYDGPNDFDRMDVVL